MEPTRKPKVIYTDSSLEFGKSFEELSWNHCTSIPHRSETNGVAERAVRRVKEGTSAVLLQSGLGNEWWADFYGMLLQSSKHSRSLVWWEDTTWKAVRNALQRTSDTVWEHWSNITLFLRRTHRDYINLVLKSCRVYSSVMSCMRGGIWKGDIMVADTEELEQMDASELHARRLHAKEVSTTQRRRNFIFPVADGTVKIFGWEQRLRTSTLIRDRPERGEEQEVLRGESDGSCSTSRQDSSWYDGQARNEFWSMSGNFIHHHHVSMYNDIIWRERGNRKMWDEFCYSCELCSQILAQTLVNFRDLEKRRNGTGLISKNKPARWKEENHFNVVKKPLNWFFARLFLQINLRSNSRLKQRIIHRFRGCGETCSEWRFGFNDSSYRTSCCWSSHQRGVAGKLGARLWNINWNNFLETSDAVLKLVEKGQILNYIRWWRTRWNWESMSRVYVTSKRRSILSERVDSWKHENRPGLGCEDLPSSKTLRYRNHGRIPVSRQNSFLGCEWNWQIRNWNVRNHFSWNRWAQSCRETCCERKATTNAHCDTVFYFHSCSRNKQDRYRSCKSGKQHKTYKTALCTLDDASVFLVIRLGPKHVSVKSTAGCDVTNCATT